MKKPWDTWVLKGLSINEAAPLFERMERIQMEPWGHAFGWKHLTLADGRKVKLTIQKNGVVPVYIAIMEGSEAEAFCVMTSGLYSVSNFNIGDIFSPEPPEGNTEEYAFVEAKSTTNMVRLPFAASAQFSEHYITEGDPNTTRYPNSLVAKKSGLYTGEMHKIVQLLAGMNSEIPYEFGWTTTHGIFINSITGDRWVVELSLDGARAWPLVGTTDRPDCPYGGALVTGFFPVPVTDLSEPDGERILCDDAELADAYLASPLSPLFGWAFSASGHEAQIVIVRSGFGTGGEYWKTFRHKVTIEADGSGDPISATMEEVESGWAWSNFIQNNVRAPAWSQCGPSMPRFGFETQPNTPPVEGDLTFPLNVYYEGEQERVFYYNCRPTYTETVDEDPVPTYDPMDCNSFIYDPAYFGSVLNSGHTDTFWGATISGIDGINTYLATSEIIGEYTETEFSLSGNFGKAGAFTAGGSPSDTAPYIYGSCHKLTKNTTRYASSSRGYFFTLMFPWFQREGFLFQEWSFGTNGEIVNKIATRYVGGTMIHYPTSNAGLTKWNYDAVGDFCMPPPCYYKYLGNCTETDPSPPSAITDYEWMTGDRIDLVSGPAFSCCFDTDQAFISYDVIGTVAFDTECTTTIDREEADIPETFQFFAAYNVKNAPSKVKLEDAHEYLFATGIYDDIGACSLINDNPMWMGVWADAFTGAGWMSPTPDMNNIGQLALKGADTYFPMMLELPHDQEVSGWFGTPFPELM